MSIWGLMFMFGIAILGIWLGIVLFRIIEENRQ